MVKNKIQYSMPNYFETHHCQLVEDRLLCMYVSKIGVDDTSFMLFTEKITTLANFY